VMIESNLVEGRQDLSTDKPLTYGQSVTDACISWSDSLVCLDHLANAVAKRNAALGRPAGETDQDIVTA